MYILILPILVGADRMRAREYTHILTAAACVCVRARIYRPGSGREKSKHDRAAVASAAAEQCRGKKGHGEGLCGAAREGLKARPTGRAIRQACRSSGVRVRTAIPCLKDSKKTKKCEKMLVEGVFLVSGVVKTVFSPVKKNKRIFLFFTTNKRK